MLASTTSAALAQQVELTWAAPSECVGERELSQRIADLLKHSADKGEALRARGRVTRRSRGYALELIVDIGGYHATRTLEATTCAALGEAAAWLIAIVADPAVSESGVDGTRAGGAPEHSGLPAGSTAIDAGVGAPAAARGDGSLGTGTSDAGTGAVPARSETAPARSDVALGAATTQARAEAAPATKPGAARVGTLTAADEESSERDATQAPSKTRARAWAGALAGLWGARLPAPQASLGAYASVRVGVWAGELRYQHVFARTQSLSERVSARISSDELEFAGCGLWGAKLRYGPCVAVAAVRSAAAARGVDDPQNQKLFWGKAGPSARVAWPVRAQFELWLEAGLGLAITRRPLFTLAGRERAVAEGGLLSGFARFGASFGSR